MSREILGDALMANAVMVGYALQLGVLPVGEDAVRRAIDTLGENDQDTSKSMRNDNNLQCIECRYLADFSFFFCMHKTLTCFRIRAQASLQL